MVQHVEKKLIIDFAVQIIDYKEGIAKVEAREGMRSKSDHGVGGGGQGLQDSLNFKQWDFILREMGKHFGISSKVHMWHD